MENNANNGSNKDSFDSLSGFLHNEEERERNAAENTDAVRISRASGNTEGIDFDEKLASIYGYGSKTDNSSPNQESDTEKTAEIVGTVGANGSSSENAENAENSDGAEASDKPFEVNDEQLKEATGERKKAKSKTANSVRRKKQTKQNQRNRTFAHIFGSVLLVVMIVSVSAFLSIYIIRALLDVTGIDMNEYDVEVEIPEYATTNEIADILSENGIIEMPELFTIYSKVTGKDGAYLDGLFNLSSTMSYNKIIRALQTTKRIQKTVSLRIKEGMTAREIGAMLEENKVCRASDFEYYYKTKQNNYSFEKRVLQNSQKFYQLEGYLFPDTYEFYVLDELEENPDMDTSSYAKIAADKMYANFNDKMTKEMYKTMNEKGFTLDELITLASMVQKEAGTLEDMSLVASVFVNRLNNPGIFPKLQSDVTVIYIEENIKPYVSNDAMSLYSSIIKGYNTYETEGLPAGPICSPGLDAINAVLTAPDTGYYYFCANEETLEMYYASDIAEHEANLVRAGLAE